MTRPRSASRAGFLLAETMITFALSALVLVGLVSAAAVLLRSTDRSVAIVGAADDLGRTLAALRRDLAGLKRARWNGEEPQSFVFRGGPNSLYFVQEASRPDGARALRVVSLREVQKKGRTQALERSESLLPTEAGGWGELRFGPPSVVPTGRARLRFRYLAEATPDAPAPRSVDAWPSGPTLPAAVVIEAVDAASAHSIVSARVAIRSDGDIGCADRSRNTANEASREGEALPGQGSRPGQASTTDVGTPTGVGTTQPFHLGERSSTANNNEFCGRADKGVGPQDDKPAALPFAGAAR